MRASSDCERYPFDRAWSIDQAMQLACLLEASAPKLGNVHPQAMFADMHFGHFLASSVCLPDLELLRSEGVGRWVNTAVRAVRSQVGRNTNLGTLLLLAPLARAANSLAEPMSRSWQEAVFQELESLTPEDSTEIYAAIRESNAGGLNSQHTADVRGEAPTDLIEAMRQVSDFDAVARQYINGFTDVFERLLPWFWQALTSREQQQSRSIPACLAAVVDLQIRWLATEPDGLIFRKQGAAEAEQVRKLAEAALGSAAARIEFEDFLTQQGNRRNPGTTADLIAATIFVALVLGEPATLQ